VYNPRACYKSRCEASQRLFSYYFLAIHNAV
jgi:hypothetical protein